LASLGRGRCGGDRGGRNGTEDAEVDGNPLREGLSARKQGAPGGYDTAIEAMDLLSHTIPEKRKDYGPKGPNALPPTSQRTCLRSACNPHPRTPAITAARAKLNLTALRRPVVESARQLEAQADDTWLWKGRRAKLVDAFTFTMPDTPENQQEFPHTATSGTAGNVSVWHYNDSRRQCHP